MVVDINLTDKVSQLQAIARVFFIFTGDIETKGEIVDG